jgi:hypothetical protein
VLIVYADLEPFRRKSPDSSDPSSDKRPAYAVHRATFRWGPVFRLNKQPPLEKGYREERTKSTEGARRLRLAMDAVWLHDWTSRYDG